MAMRVATFAINDQMITAALRTQATMANQQIQEASGLISSDFAGLGATAQHVINLQVSVARSQSYIDASSLADSKVQVMYSAVGSMADVITNFRSLLTGASLSSATGSASTIQSAQAMMEQIAGLMNTQYNGEYVFSGGRTDTAPVDLSDSTYAANTASASTPDTSYYQGDSQAASVRVSDSQTISYGVTADNTGFEEALRALKLVANSSSLDSTTISQALALASTALDDTSVVQTKLANAASAIETASSGQTEYQSYLKTLGTSLTSVDVAAVTAQLSTYQAQLTASYSAIAKIQGLNLASYLR
ncbi:flagellin [Bradyrhizobium prioriisuperbiae]|uniref:flagellin n=1 Tax=Bradyrhizobium prioriisuperbiae TaxID=2854389 RepID=UPI0028E86009|nr:flagellin [Bradyrhizobium prioritasuperba]